MKQSERLIWLIKYLLGENEKYSNVDIPENQTERFNLYRSLVNVRMPYEISEEYLKIEDEYLTQEKNKKGITRLEDLKEAEKDIYLWQGDITTLECDAIVNAANSEMLGCFCPCHACIDNCIHTFSGVRLRLECNEIMEKQGHSEPTGKAKITKAYNLPCKNVIHTVGPIVSRTLTQKHRELLKSCYNECLRAADENGIKSIAFCCISTGEFCFPNYEAAEIAVDTVRAYKESTSSNIKVIFNVFKDLDLNIYKNIFNN